MARRREFTQNQKEDIVLRATDANGVVHCERCGGALKRGTWEIDHILAEGLRPEADKQKPLTITEGQLLGKDCCHRGADGKTNQDVKQIAKAKRQAAGHLGIKRAKQAIPQRPKALKPERDRLPPPPRRNPFTHEEIR